MPSFTVDVEQLRGFGSEFTRLGTDEVGPLPAYCCQYAGQTDGLTGLLNELSATVSGYAAEGVAYGLSEHYAHLVGVISDTGAGLGHTADVYQGMDQKTRATLDGSAPVVGGATDATATGDPMLTAIFETLQPTTPDSDPTKSARDNLDIDVQVVDWLFYKVTSHHITEPIEAMIGNWTTLTANGQAYANIAALWRDVSAEISANATGVDAIWDGNAAKTFHEYCDRLAQALLGEADLCDGLQLVLNKIASAFENAFNGALSLLTEVIRILESAALWLATLWWCGAGEAESIKGAWDAYRVWKKSEELSNLIITTIKNARLAMVIYYKLKDAITAVTSIPGEIADKLSQIKDLISDVGAAPSVIAQIAALSSEPTIAYGGPNAPGIK